MIGWVLVLLLGLALIVAGIEGQVGVLIADFLCPDEVQATPLFSGASTTEASFIPAAVSSNTRTL